MLKHGLISAPDIGIYKFIAWWGWVFFCLNGEDELNTLLSKFRSEKKKDDLNLDPHHSLVSNKSLSHTCTLQTEKWVLTKKKNREMSLTHHFITLSYIFIYLRNKYTEKSFYYFKSVIQKRSKVINMCPAER